MSTSITTSEILDALRAAANSLDNGPGDAMTMQEIRDGTGWAHIQARRHILALKSQGILQACRVRRMGVDDVSRMVQAYRVVTPPEAPARAGTKAKR